MQFIHLITVPPIPGAIEGLKTLKVVKKIADEHNVEMPIVDSLYKIIYKGESLNGSIQKVLGKDMIKDVEFIN